MRAIIVIITILVLSFVAGPAVAAKPAPAAGVVFTLTPHPDLDAAAIAADWSKNTDITVVVGQCTSGPYCIHLAVAADDAPCGEAALRGCAATLPDGSCQATVEGYLVRDGGPAELYVAKHEVGHCIWYAGGKRSHLDDPKALMYFGFQLGVQRAVLTNADRQTTRSLF